MTQTADSPQKETDIIKRDIARPVIFVLIVCIGIGVGFFTPLKHYLTIDRISAFAENLGAWGPVILLIIGTISPLLFIPRWPVCFVGGMLYGIFWGTIIGNVASILGAWLHYKTAKSLVSDSSAKLLGKFNLDVNKLRTMNSFWVIFILRAVPISNSAATNLLAGMLKISTGNYLLSSFLGMIPSTIMYAAWGKLMKKPDPIYYLIAPALLIIIIISTIIVRHYITKTKSKIATNKDVV